MSLAIFDLDNTLIGGDSDFLWGEFLGEEGSGCLNPQLIKLLDEKGLITIKSD